MIVGSAGLFDVRADEIGVFGNVDFARFESAEQYVVLYGAVVGRAALIGAIDVAVAERERARMSGRGKYE